ncbi:HAD family hydrolase [Trinickia dinghuensis]|uniref:HAD family phosphatase n=1 Tax=Trinickia dinghuensis TaxID=2291023 RepID=A0A3D8K529_9BURK|nr:HAD family phosphatase [Trinickia dinghuensis]RDU99681.1 HAD family phosphatase [Trinickia dinghuensis]
MTGSTIRNAGELRRDRVLICDCDGVLIDSEAVAAKMLVQELQARWPHADVEPVVMPLLGLRIERVLEASAAALGQALAPIEMDAIRRSVEAAAQQAPVVAGVEAALEQIALTKACASNSYTAYVHAVLARTGLDRFFGSHVFCADRVPRPKPAPDIYIAVADALGVASRACIVVEDSVAGVAAASSAGMVVLGFAGGTHAEQGGRAHAEALVQAGAQRVFDDMSALPALVGQWMSRVADRAGTAMNGKGDGSWQA